MSRLIVDIDSVIDLFECSDEDLYARGTIEDAIYDGKLKSVDAVEVVRCKDCRWGHLCVFGQHLGLDGFCSKGERKEQSNG